MGYVCVSCGASSKVLYNGLNSDIIKLAHCTNCKRVVDKYIEYDLVVVSLDAVLLKRQAFRHILINSGIRSHWKFCLVLLLCETLAKLLRQSFTDQSRPWLSDNVLYSALEIDLYWNFLTASIELFSMLFVVLILMLAWKYGNNEYKWPSWREFVSGLMLSNFGKMFVLPAILWGQQYSILYTGLCNIFTMAANVQAIRVLCEGWSVWAVVFSVMCGHAVSMVTSHQLQQINLAIT